MNETIVINGIVYLVITADVLQQMFGITIDVEVGLVYAGPETGTFTEEVIEVPESITAEGQTVPVVGFVGGMMALEIGNAAASVSEVILPSSILFLIYGFSMFTNLQKVTCYAETAPKLSSEIGEPVGTDFEGTPETKELYIPAGSDYSTWTVETTWGSVNEIYDGFVETVNGLKYKETGETTVALIGYDETFTATSLTIPSSITHEGNTYTVTEIKNNAFKNYTELTEVNIPDSVTKISENAFSNTEPITEPISVNNISLNLIGKNTKIDKFVLKNTLGITFTYGDITETSVEYACECLGLTDNTISTPDLDLTNLTYDGYQLTIYTIIQNAFYGCSGLASIDLPDSITTIGVGVFSGCSSLTSVNIPDSVTSIGVGVFSGCSSLTSVNIPDSVTSIGYSAFEGCSSLTSVIIPNSVTSIGGSVFQNCSSLKSVIIPNSVTSINSYTFSGCSSLTSITIPDSVTFIGEYAFYNCINLTSVNIPDSVTSIEYSAFSGCKSLTSITIPDSVTSIGNSAFSDCRSLTSIVIPENVTSIGNSAFSDCRSLTSITIPDSVTSIGNSAFYCCSNLVDVYLPSNNATIDSTAFIYTGRINVDGIYYGGNRTVNIGKYTFNYVGFVTFYLNGNATTITSSEIGVTGYDESLSGDAVILSVLNYQGVNYSVTTIGQYAFYSCDGLTSVTIPENITSIESYAFYGCSSLNTLNFNAINCDGFSNNKNPFTNCPINILNIGDSVKRIPNYFAYNFDNLTSIDIPDSVTTIESSAFADCSSLTSVILPDNATIDLNAFANTGGRINIDGFYCIGKEKTVNIGKYIFNNVGFVTFYLNGNKTTITPSEVVVMGCDESLSGDIVIPSILNYQGVNCRVTSIGKSAFENCKSLTSVNIPDSVTSIESSTFMHCSSLTSVTIGNSVTSIGLGAFYYCSSLTSITIPNSVTHISSQVFQGCSNLTSVTIGNSITRIESSTFSGCPLTTVIMLDSTAPKVATNYISNNIFSSTPSTKVLIVPVGATGYSTSWCNTKWAAVNYTMVPTNNVNYKLNDTNIIETFNSNNKTETLTIPNTVTYNGNTFSVNKLSRNSLANDNVVKSLTIESGINKIEASALSGCNNLETVNIPESVAEIDNHVFWMCRNLKNIVLPNTLTQLKPEMFVACEELETITIPNGITTIPFRMFEGCKKLTTVNLPSTINKIQWSAFKDCESLTNITIPSGCNVDTTAFEGTNIKV